MKAVFTALVLSCFFTAYSQETFSVHFDFATHELLPAARLRLDSFLLAEKTHLPAMSIRLNGHCDGIGSDLYNDKLSQRRAAAVKNYLLSSGVPPARVTELKGHGKKEPLNENGTPEERQLNRRVEISFIHTQTNSGKLTVQLKDKIADSSTTVGSNIVLRNINFYGGTRVFLPESTTMLEELLDAMRTYPQLVIRVEGHICCQPHTGDGMDAETGIYNLSETRARAVMEYLVNNNIAQSRVQYKGFGHSAPIYPYPENTEEERIQNRRVGIKILSK